MSNEIIYNNISDYLTNRCWVLVNSDSRYSLFGPPQDLGFERSYHLHVPNRTDKRDFTSDIQKLVEIISSIYDYDSDDLSSIIIEDKQILQFHVDLNNETSLKGHPSVPFFDDFLTRIKDLLQNTATFSITKKPHFYNQIEESERYLNLCKFLKNTSGSLITKIQLPKKEDIKVETVFDEPVKGEIINNELLEIISFVNNDIVSGRVTNYTEEYLRTNKSVISVNVIDKIHDLYRDIKFNDIDISLLGIGPSKVTIANDLSPKKNLNIKNFTKTVKEKINEITSEDVLGKVISLTSKDISSDQNTITVLGTVRNISTEITVKLTHQYYQKAIKAHGLNKGIFLNGVLEKEKTRYKLIKLNKFSIIGMPEEDTPPELPLKF